MEPSYPFPQSLPFRESEIACRVLLWTWAAFGWFAVIWAWKRSNRWLDRPSTWLLYVVPGVVLYLSTLMPAWRADWSVHAGIIAIALAANAGGTRLLIRTEATRGGQIRWVLLNAMACLLLIPFLSGICTSGHTLMTMFPCRFSLMSLGQGLGKYEEKHERLPPLIDNDGITWRLTLLPFLKDFGEKSDAVFHVEQSWNAPDNVPAAHRRIYEYSCPAHNAFTDSEGRWYTAFAAVTGPGTLFPPEGNVARREIKDGTSNTAMIVEACGLKIVWTEPRDADVSELAAGVNMPGRHPGESSSVWSSLHTISPSDASAFTLMASGEVRMISSKTDPKILQALLTIDGGEEIKDW